MKGVGLDLFAVETRQPVIFIFQVFFLINLTLVLIKKIYVCSKVSKRTSIMT